MEPGLRKFQLCQITVTKEYGTSERRVPVPPHPQEVGCDEHRVAIEELRDYCIDGYRNLGKVGYRKLTSTHEVVEEVDDEDGEEEREDEVVDSAERLQTPLPGDVDGRELDAEQLGHPGIPGRGFWTRK